MSSSDAQTVCNTTLSPEFHLITVTVLNTSIEVEQRVQCLDDQDPKVSGPTVVRHFFFTSVPQLLISSLCCIGQVSVSY